MRAGSLINMLGDNSAADTFKVGDGATINGWSDRTPVTVIAVNVSKSGKTVTVTLQEDKATRIDNNGMSEAQEYTFERDPDGRTYEAKLTRRGFRVGGVNGSAVIPGRNKYYDYSF